VDGTIMAAFGLSTITEDHAFLACRAALAAQRAVDEVSGGAARLRAGIDTGDIIVEQGMDSSDGRFQMSGSAPRVAGRLMRALRRATIAVSARARAAAGGYVRMQLMAPSDHPHVGRDDRIHELLGENQALSRWHLRAHGGLTDLTGREAELTVLRSAWRRVREGHGQIVGIVAEPGLGKSRLTHEFISSPEVASFQVLETGALEFARRTPLGVMKTLLLTACGIDIADDLKPSLDRLTKKLKELDLAPEILMPLTFLADMHQVDDEWMRLEAREKTLRVSDALRSFLVAMSRRSPLVILFEDLHWIDAESEFVLNRFADSITANRILLIATYRPDYVHEWSRRGCFQQIRLERFMKDETRTFLTRLIGDDSGLHELREMLAENAEGTPLYLEEMVRMLIERGNLAGKPGAYTLAREVSAIDIPQSVQSLVAARVNQLAAGERQVLQLAAVIGRNVPAPLLKALAPVGALELVQALSRLQTQEFLFEVQSLPYPEYMFKHAVTQRVAYDSILLEDRRRLHGEILAALERLSTGSESHFVETLAEHAIRAEAWEAAARYAKEAAARAVERSAFRTAARFLEDSRRAVSMLPESPQRQEREIDIATAMRPIFGVLGEYEKAAGPLAEARRLAEELGDQDRLYEVLLHQSYLNSTFGNFDDAFEPAEAMKQSALVSGTPRCVAEADLAASQALLLRSRSREVVERLKPHREGFLGEWRYERFGQMGIRSVWYLGHTAQAHARLGAFEEADEAILRAREIATEVQRPIDLSSVVYFAGLVDILRGASPAMVEELRRHVDREGFGAGLFIRGWLLPVLGHALFQSGDNEGACDTLEEAIDHAERQRLVQCEVHARALLACSRTRLGLPEAASNLDHALELARRQCNPWAEILVLRGLAELKPSRAGLDFLEQACEVSRRHEIAPELARSLMALGLRRRQANIAGAEECLAEAATLAATMKLRDIQIPVAIQAASRQPEPVATM
jgi:tetratricopeptide (TPR) repeat protein